jgi:hypothetical protein
VDFTKALIADAAAVQGGKLYIHGGGWDRIFAASLPWVHPTLALAFVLRVEYLEALTDYPIVIELLDDDEQAVLPAIEGTVRVGHPPMLAPGSPLFVPQAITLNALQFAKHGPFRFRIKAGDSVAEVPFYVSPPQPSSQ